jgi:hypothetical protein
MSMHFQYSCIHSLIHSFDHKHTRNQQFCASYFLLINVMGQLLTVTRMELYGYFKCRLLVVQRHRKWLAVNLEETGCNEAFNALSQHVSGVSMEASTGPVLNTFSPLLASPSLKVVNLLVLFLFSLSHENRQWQNSFTEDLMYLLITYL